MSHHSSPELPPPATFLAARQLVSNDGFEGMVAQVAAIEKELGIFDLARFTPK